MRIFIDESGTFTAAGAGASTDSWCVLTAYLSPEQDAARLASLLQRLRDSCGGGSEVKLGAIDESQYVRFLRDLSRLRGLAFAVAVDVSLHTRSEVEAHRDGQAAKLIEHREKISSATVREQLTAASEQLASLPAQLYTQLQCQVELFHRVLRFAPAYYAQHWPEALARFAWRIDRKDRNATEYEKVLRTVLPMALQTLGMGKGVITLEDADHSHMERFAYPVGDAPTHLRDVYKLNAKTEGAFNIGMMINEDFELVDSVAEPGVQAADLLASGIRRLFLGKFRRDVEVAHLLGGNMLTALAGDSVIRLISLDRSKPATERTARYLGRMAASAKPIVS